MDSTRDWRTGARPAAAALALLVGLTLALGFGAPPAAASSTPDLRRGAVFSMSNSPHGNSVVAFSRAVDGTLRRVGSFPTRGRGSGGFEDTANGLVLGSARGESAPNNLLSDTRLLFATNAGSDTISVFRVQRHGLKLVEVQRSFGTKPVSITINRGIAYVLNSGETVDGLVPPNCASGHLPAITGFRVAATGQLTHIPGSTRLLSRQADSGCAQVSFNPSGKVLVVTERTAKTAGQAADDEGVILTYRVRHDGTLGHKRIYDATGQGPFGFTFNKQGALLTSEQFDGMAGPGRGAAAGYRLNDDGTLVPTSRSVHNGGTDTCWFVITDNGKYGYATSFFGTGRISSYRVGSDGSLRLLDATAADVEVQPGASDLSLSRDSRFLYQLNSFEGTISTFMVGADGSLRLIDKDQAHEPSPTMAAPLGLASS